jgi:hypothetical protein
LNLPSGGAGGGAQGGWNLPSGGGGGGGGGAPGGWDLPGGGTGGWDLPSGGGGQSQGQSCTNSVQCVNGACTCGDGPAKGQSCDGAAASGANSCNVLCHFCQ